MRIAAKCSKEPQQGLKPILAEPLTKTRHLCCAGKYFPILAEIGVFQQNKPEADSICKCSIRHQGRRAAVRCDLHQCLQWAGKLTRCSSAAFDTKGGKEHFAAGASPRGSSPGIGPSSGHESERQVRNAVVNSEPKLSARVIRKSREVLALSISLVSLFR